MPEADVQKEKQKEFYLEIPQKNEAFFLKGSNNHDWGFKNRLARIFNPVSGKTVMLAFDHGYFQGPTTGLERIDVTIEPLVPHADALMLT
ncbi:MAG: 3-hydroxy-5-phosphonooxypentane-2,4-dione thiolase LsrF, partial [Fibrobacter sp.]|nr:3-hydroxy-5-phosphonooxypentane-2,4-dione thiolase LsrF [Fibrobacter sp.]